MWDYCYANLTISSTLDFPELLESSSKDTCDISSKINFILNSPAQSLKQRNFYHYWENFDKEKWLYFSKENNTFYITINKIAEFILNPNTRKINCTPLNDIPLNTIRHIFLDTVIPLFLSLNPNLLILHGSLLQKNKVAIAFIGESGFGKSSIANFLSNHGWKIMSDDVVIIQEENALPSYPGIRLWPSMLKNIDKKIETQNISHLNDKKRVLINFAKEKSALKAIFYLKKNEENNFHISDLFSKLTSSSFILDVKSEELLKSHFNHLKNLLEKTSIELMHYKKNEKSLNQILEKTNFYSS